MKFSVAQHKEMVKNTRRHYEEQRAIANRMLESVERLRINLLKYEQQIQEAEERGLDSFDSERFGKKKTTR